MACKLNSSSYCYWFCQRSFACAKGQQNSPLISCCVTSYRLFGVFHFNTGNFVVGLFLKNLQLQWLKQADKCSLITGDTHLHLHEYNDIHNTLRKKVLPSTFFFMLQLITNRGLVSVPGKTMIAPSCTQLNILIVMLCLKND